MAGHDAHIADAIFDARQHGACVPFAALSRLCILLEHHNVHLDYTNHCRIFMRFRGSSEVQMDHRL